MGASIGFDTTYPHVAVSDCNSFSGSFVSDVMRFEY
jgi:hypothetical protein